MSGRNATTILEVFLPNYWSYVEETFLAIHYIQKDSKESTFWSDITSRPEGPAKKSDILTSVLNFAYISAIGFGSAFFYLSMILAKTTHITIKSDQVTNYVRYQGKGIEQIV